jgi:hypothetical protein
VFVGRSAGESKMNTKEALGYIKQLLELRRFVASHPKLSQSHRRLSIEELRAARPYAL